jgi:hypothetical protein
MGNAALFAGNSLDKARTIFARFIKRRPRAMLNQAANSRIERVEPGRTANLLTRDEARRKTARLAAKRIEQLTGKARRRRKARRLMALNDVNIGYGSALDCWHDAACPAHSRLRETSTRENAIKCAEAIENISRLVLA